LLEAEGVRFDAAGKVDFEAVGWDGPDDAWRAARGLLPPKPLRKSSPPPPGQLSLF
jgi:hypothetical protein